MANKSPERATECRLLLQLSYHKLLYICFIDQIYEHQDSHLVLHSRRYLPYPVSGWRRNVDRQRSLQVLHLHGEEERRVGHFLHLLFDELCLCGLLKVFGFGDLVHEAHDLAGFVASSPTLADQRRNSALLICYFYVFRAMLISPEH